MLKDALSYPFRGNGGIMIILGTIMSFLIDVGSVAPILGLVAYTLGGGYFLSYYFDIINSSATGSDESPTWPSLSDLLGDIILPSLRFLLASLMGAIVLILATTTGVGLFKLIGWLVYAVYVPMAVLGVAIQSDAKMALPHRVIPAIKRCLPTYWWAVGGVLTVVLVVLVLQAILGSIPLLGLILSTGCSLYGSMAMARLVGLVYRAHPTVFDIEDDEAELADDHQAAGVHPRVDPEPKEEPSPPPVPMPVSPARPPIPPIPPSQRVPSPPSEPS